MLSALLFLAVLTVLGGVTLYAVWGDRFQVWWHDWYVRRPYPPVTSPSSNVTVRPIPYDWASDPEMAS